ncbi:MAG: DUF2341 domain-containing protein [Patescibacteria group bacterium]
MPTRKNVDSITRVNSFSNTSISGEGLKSPTLKPHIKKSSYRKLTSFFLIFAMLFQIIGGIFLFVPKENEVKADASISWYDSSWLHRKAITINGSTAGAQTNYQVSVPVTYSANMKADFSDIRFTDSNGTTLLNHWMESKTDSTSANFWVKIPSILASPSTATIYMYYGNGAATSTSSGSDTFNFFDDFNTIPSPTNPVIEPSQTWEMGGQSRFGTIASLNGTYYMYYTSGGIASSKVGIATSTDLKTWTKDSRNPIINNVIAP